MPAQTGRRAFLTSSLGGSLTAAIAALTGCKPPPERSAAPGAEVADALTAEHVAAAERLAGIEYTAAERQMIVDSIEDQLSLLEARRTFMPEDDLAPATVFDPRLPGFSLPSWPSFAGPLLTVTNFTGHPSLTLRIGFQQAPTRTIHGTPAEPLDPARHRVPYGITLWGRLFDEATLIRVGRALETALNVAHERPPGF